MLNFAQLTQTLMLPQVGNAAIETVLNYLINRTPKADKYLTKLKGQVLAINIEKVEFTWYFIFSEQKIDVLKNYEGDTDCHITIAPSLLFKLPKKNEISENINNKSLHISGNLETLQYFVALLEFLEKDPAELLSPYLGDVVSQSAVSLLQNLTSVLKQRCEQSQVFWSERLSEELQVLAPKLAVIDFNDQVEILVEHADKVADKLQQLENMYSQKSKQ